MFILNSLISLFNKVKNYLSNMFGFSVDDSDKNYLKDLSGKVSSLFINTNVYCYMYKSPSINAIAMPLTSFSSSPAFFKLFGTDPVTRKVNIGNHSLSLKPLQFLLATIDSLLLGIVTLPKHLLIPNVVFDNTSKKASLGISSCIIFISSTAVEKLNDSELIALALHEIGHNLQFFSTLLTKILSLSLFAVPISSLIFFFDYNFNSPNSKWLAWVLGTVSVSLLLKLISSAKFSIRKFKEKDADSFAVAMGFGDHFVSMLTKLKDNSVLNNINLQKNSFAGGFSNQEKSKFFDSALFKKYMDNVHLANSNFNSSNGISPYLSFDKRLQFVKNQNPSITDNSI